MIRNVSSWIPGQKSSCRNVASAANSRHNLRSCCSSWPGLGKTFNKVSKYIKNINVQYNVSPTSHRVNRNDLIYTQGYGMTETCIVTVNLPNSPHRESTGVLLPDFEIKVVKPHCPKGIGLGVKEHGELWIRSPSVMKGYFNSPEASAAMLTPDGWLKTGDAGYYNDMGYFFLTGRFKDLIKVKGFQVMAVELEEILLRHEQVEEVAVVGMPDYMSGEIPVAVVVLKPNSKVKETDLMDLVAENVAEYKHLGYLVFVESIPKNDRGKILRNQIKYDLKKLRKNSVAK